MCCQYTMLQKGKEDLHCLVHPWGLAKTAMHSPTSGAAGWEWLDSMEAGLISISLGHDW